jgi:hypothetical protein
MLQKLSAGGMNKSMNALLNSLVASKANLISMNGEIKKFIKSLAESLKYNIANSIWRGAQQEFQKAISFAETINKQLTQIATVSETAASNLKGVMASAQEGAKNLHISTQEYLDAA